jgi:tellurite resistance protein TerC
VIVEVTDLVFAVDSIPAIFAITDDRFILYTSNVFAILGLRSLFFLLAGVIQKFHYLRFGLALVLSFIGAKMLLVAVGVKISIDLSLVVVAVVLAGSIVASMIRSKRVESDVRGELPVDPATSAKSPPEAPDTAETDARHARTPAARQ